jgi:rare lipoprotein A (peptidoglycan hydrolase)
MFLVPLAYLSGVPERDELLAFDVASGLEGVRNTPADAPGINVGERLARSTSVALGAPPTSTPAAAAAAAGGGRRQAEKERAPSAGDDVSDVAAPPVVDAPSTATTVAMTTTTVAGRLSLPATIAPASRGAGKVRSARGLASWFNAPDGTCAHVAIPIGAEVTVTRVATGKSTTCVVDQWGPADTSRIIDLSMDTFEQLAAPEAGLIEVVIEW